MSEWQPISSAPKDGTQVLIYAARNAYVAFWPDQDAELKQCWYLNAPDDGLQGFRRIGDPAPTHWMPLPAAPV